MRYRKALTNWRYYVLSVLFAVGFVATAAIFGESDLPLSEWLYVTVMYASVASASFGAFGRLERLWEREGKIPEITKLKYD